MTPSDKVFRFIGKVVAWFVLLAYPLAVLATTADAVVKLYGWTVIPAYLISMVVLSVKVPELIWPAP